MNNPAIPSPIPLTLISGFLGAGKTTLLNQILNADHGLKVAVLVNDFGAINIDSRLVSQRSEALLSLANGCICCSIQSDLVAQLSELLSAPDHDIEYLLIEASGVSDPYRIIQALRYPQLRQRITIDSVICVVDALQCGALEGDMALLAREQLAAADLVVINKTDLASAEQIGTLKQQWLYPDSRLLETQFGQLPLALVLGVGRFDINGHPAGAPDNDPSGGADRHRHGKAGDFETFSWYSERPLSLTQLRRQISQLPLGIYRGKGLFYVDALPEQPALLQWVGSRIEWSKGELWGDRQRCSELVLIGTPGVLTASALSQGLNQAVL